jgi:hypothetical protein
VCHHYVPELLSEQNQDMRTTPPANNKNTKKHSRTSILKGVFTGFQ